MLNRRNLLAGGTLSALLYGTAASGSKPRENLNMRQRVEKDIRSWDTITDHRTGTEGASRTTTWLAAEIRSLGLDPIIEAFPFARRVLHDCFIKIGRDKVTGVPLFDGGYTDFIGVSGLLGPLESKAPIGLTEFSPIPRANAELESARRNSSFAAIVAVARGDVVRPGLSLLNADDYLTPYGPPVLQVATEHRDLLQAALAPDTQAKDARAKLVAHVTIENTIASNVQVRIPGRDAKLAPIIIMTPMSAWWTCTSERAGGITIWLECIRHFAADKPDRGLIFTANTGHELGHVGLDRYLEQNREQIQDAHAWIHLGANFAARDGSIRYQASDKKLEALGLRALNNQQVTVSEITPLGQRPYGEARNIFDGGGRFISLLGSNNLFHHPDDRWPGAVDLDKTLNVTRAMLDAVTQLSRD